MSKGLEHNLLLNQILIFVAADPGWAGSESGRVVSRLILDRVVMVTWTHNIELGCWLLGRRLGVGHLVEVVVHNLAKIDLGVLLNLNFGLLINLDAGSVDDTKITNVVLAILADDHELAFPELFVVRNLIMVGFTLSDLEHTLRAIDRDSKILQLFGINCLESHMQFVLRRLVW